MDILSQNKTLLLVLAAIVLVGAVAFFIVPNAAVAPGSEDTEEVEEAPSADAEVESPSKSNVRPAEDEEEEPEEDAALANIQIVSAGPVVAILKDVGEAAYKHFGLVQKDFSDIRSVGFDVIEGNFDMCATDANVRFFLDSANAADLKVILSAGAGEAEWGYPCDEEPPEGLRPVWQREAVWEWVSKWKDHPALYAWDTSNEDGGTFPFGTGGTDPDPAWEEKYSLSTAQLQEAYRDVKAWDPAHSVMIRMNGWYFYDYPEDFFRPGNAFGKDVADIVMINAYANVDDYFKDFVSTVLIRATRSIYELDPDTKIIPALGVWEEPPIWVAPTRNELINDFNQAVKTESLSGIAFFKYGASSGSDWFLPSATRGDPVLWETIRELIGS